MREIFASVDAEIIYVVPNFISEGYFTRDVIPRELQLTGPITRFPRQTVYYCDPVGIHPSMTNLLLKRASEVAPGVDPHHSSLIIVGHGTGLNDNSTKAIKDQVEFIKNRQIGFAEVIDAYMEEPPLISKWTELTTAKNVIVVPFFIADGLHSYQDIPVMLGVETEPTAAASQMDVFRRNPYHLQDRNLFYSAAIGTEPMLASVILDQIATFDAQHLTKPQEHETVHAALSAWLASGGQTIGEIAIRTVGDGFCLTHREDAESAALLTQYEKPEQAREIAKYDAKGDFRPVKTAPSLTRGWQLNLASQNELQLALEFFYPAALGVALRLHRGELAATPLQSFFGRQTGMYRVTGLAQAEETTAIAAETCCDAQCLRRCLWPWAADQPVSQFPPEKRQLLPEIGTDWPLYCVEPCPALVGNVRATVRARLKAAQS